MRLFSVLLTFAWFSCNGHTGPTPPPTTTTTTTTVPPHDRGIPFSFRNTRGILVFPGTQASAGEIRQLDIRLARAGWPRPFYHVCAETSFWRAQNIPLPGGPQPFDDGENVENLVRFLDTTAQLGSQVLLDVYCTVRDARPEAVPDDRFFAWAGKVARIASEYDHVAIHIANEWWHGGSRLRDEAAMRRAHWNIRLYFSGLVSSDDNFNPGDIRFNSIGGILQWPDAHPWRNPDPNLRQIQDMVDRNAGFLVISEPTAYSSWSNEGCCTKSKAQIMTYMQRCESTPGCVWTFHSTDGLRWPAEVSSFEWIPGEP